MFFICNIVKWESHDTIILTRFAIPLFCNQVDDLSFNGDPELEHVDNTEKRAISYEHLAQQLEQQQPEEAQQQPEEAQQQQQQQEQQLPWAQESDNEVVLPEFVQSPVDELAYHHHHHQHHYQQQYPHQQFQQHQYTQQQTEPEYPHHQQQTFLAQLLPSREEPVTGVVAAQTSFSPINLAAAADGADLSAFHALMAQTVPRSEFPALQLLNPRDPHQRHGTGDVAPSYWPSQDSTSAAQYSSSQQQLLYPPPSSLV
jgi:hypothetical protein